MSENNKYTIALVAELLEEKMATNTIILDIRKISIIADYFIITTIQSPSYCKTIIKSIIKLIKENNIKGNINIEGNENTGWVLIDCDDIVIHLFSEERRNYYRLEQLWQDADLLNI